MQFRFVCLFVVAASWPLLAQTQETSPKYAIQTATPPKVLAEVQTAISRLAETGQISKHVDSSGRLRYLGGFRTRSYSGDPEAAARSFLAEFPGLLGLRGPTRKTELELVNSRELQGLRFVRFQQKLQGIPVLGGQIVVGVTAANQAFQATTHFREDLKPAGDWVLTEKEALDAVLAHKPVELDGDPTFQRYWSAEESGAAVPVWIVMVQGKEPFGSWSFEVDARSGDIRDVQDLIQGANEASVYVTNPAKGPPQNVALQNLLPGGLLSGAYARATTDLSGIFLLFGVVSPTTYLQTAMANANKDFVFEPFDPEFFFLPNPDFAEAQLYHGVDRAHEAFSNLGFFGLDRPLDAIAYDPEALIYSSPYYNPLHSAGAGGVFFAPVGPGPIADATWDTDVIFHEYTHAVVRWFVGIQQSSEFRALNEGYADYFSSSFLDDPNVAEFVGPILRQSLGAKPLPYLRTLSNPRNYPGDLVGQIHIDGLIWGGALWDIRSTLGPALADSIALGGLEGLAGFSGFYTAALSTQAYAYLVFGQTVGDQVTAILGQRGILTPEGQKAAEAFRLSSGVPNSDTNPGVPGICWIDRQWKIDVPHGAQTLGVGLAGTADLQLLVRFRRPIIVQGGAPISDRQTGFGPSVGTSISLTDTPELQAGTYYLGVVNCNGFPVPYSISAGYAGGPYDDTPNTTLIQSGSSATGSVVSGPFINSRQFSVGVPAGSTGLTVTVSGSTDVDLFLKNGSHVRYGPQGLPASDAAVESSAFSETITLTTNTVPSVQPGTYYIAVGNAEDQPAGAFSVSASATQAPTQPPAVTPLGSAPVGVPVPAAAPGLGLLASSQYTIQVPPSATRLDLTAQSSLADAIVYLRRDHPVSISSRQVNSDAALPLRYGTRLQLTSNTASQFVNPLQPGTYYVGIVNYGPQGGSVTLSANTSTPVSLGAFTNGAWFLDRDGDFAFNAATEISGWGSPGDIPVNGDWNGDGARDLGVFSNGTWFLDMNGDGAFNPATDVKGWGAPGWTPVTGDWNGDGITDIGAIDPATMTWFLDLDGDFAFDAATEIRGWGSPGNIPVVGDWDGDGSDEIGVFAGGAWFRDMDGDGAFNPATDIRGWGVAGWIPVTGDWNGDGVSDIGAIDPATMTWFRDMDGDGGFDAATEIAGWGSPGDTPVVADWDGDGDDDLGVFSGGTWFIDANGNQGFDPATDARGWGAAGWMPVPGEWQ